MRPAHLLALALMAGSLALPLQAQTREIQRWQWPNTDFDNAIVDFSEIISGGVPRDGIPALDAPGFLPADEETRLGATEPVVTVAIDGAPARAYPLRYLTWHEIVNDEVAGIPVAVTFCPLCNTSVVFDRRVGDRVLSFGVSGNLRFSDMVMYDRETESWWQQAVGQSIVGELAGTELESLPTWVESWDSFRANHPDGLVMDQPEARRAYGRNPYLGYDSSTRPFLYTGENPPHGIPPLERVVRVEDRAWPLTRLAETGEITEAGVTISWQAGVASALDTARISEGRDIGQIRVRDAAGGGDVVHDVMFAFAFHAFWPEGRWMLGEM